jgi:hypothetical protein
MDTPAPPLDPRCKLARPERIDIGDDVLVRSDLIAKAEGTCERTVNRNEARGAPYVLIGGVKYRPLKRYQQWRASTIQQIKPQPKARGQARRERA